MSAIIINEDSEEQMYIFSKEISDITYKMKDLDTYKRNNLPNGIFFYDQKTKDYFHATEIFEKINNILTKEK